MQRRRRECAVVHAVVHKHNKATSLYIQGSTCPWHRFTQSAVDAIAVAGPGLGAAMVPAAVWGYLHFFAFFRLGWSSFKTTLNFLAKNRRN